MHNYFAFLFLALPKRSNATPTSHGIGGTMEPMRAITLLLKITEEFLGGVRRSREVVPKCRKAKGALEGLRSSRSLGSLGTLKT